MAKATHLYSCRSGAIPTNSNGLIGAYVISKLSEDDLEVLASYHITEAASGTLHCDCPAHKPWCRHCDMLRKFQAENHIDRGWLYSFDKDKWIPPVSIES